MWLLPNTVTTEGVIHANKSTVLSRFYLIILLSQLIDSLLYVIYLFLPVLDTNPPPGPLSDEISGSLTHHAF